MGLAAIWAATPWAAVWMAVTAALACVAIVAGDRRRALALAGVFLALPATFFLYNLSALPGPLWAGMLWPCFASIYIYQWLNLRTPAILGILVGVPFIGYSFGWWPEFPAQVMADALGLAMVATLGGPSVASLVGRIARPDIAHRRSGDSLARVVHHRAGAPDP